MTNSNNSSTPHLPQTRSKWSWLPFLIVAPIGFIDAAYLTIEHYLNRVPPCSIVSGCEVVTTSQYSAVFGVPIALFGALYYLAIIVGVVAYLDTKKEKILSWVSWATIIGFLTSIYLVGLQLFVLHAICLYCMGSAISSTLLFIFGLCQIKMLRSPRS